MSPDPPQTVDQMAPSGAPTYGNIFLTEPGSDEVVQLTSGAGRDQRPCLSPDGSTVVFVSDRGGGITLWSVPAAGDADPQPLPYRGWAYRPWYSVDGDWIFFFHRETDGRDQIYLTSVSTGLPGSPLTVPLAGRDQIYRTSVSTGAFEPLTNDDEGQSRGPFADPAGEVLLMHSTREGGRFSLWQLPLDGATPRRLQPPGIEHATHGTRSRTGAIAFDVFHRVASDGV